MADTIIDLLRHGEPVGGSRYRGHGIDDPLSEAGWAQMWQAVAADDPAPWTAVITSPLSRCHAFAQRLADRHDLPLEVRDGVKEVGFGAWEGRTRAELKRDWALEYSNFHRDPVRMRPVGAEPLEQFAGRVVSALETIVVAHDGSRVLVVAHAGVLRVALATVLGAPLESLYRIHIPFAGRLRIRHGDTGMRIEVGCDHGTSARRSDF
ncbi:MAG: histidine phosphatase family protein [Thiotrichales bacterium]